MLSSFRIIILAILLTTMVGCHGEDPQPELRDPIYSDLGKRAKEFEDSSKTLQETLAGLKESLEKAEPNTLERKDIQKKIAKTTREARDAEQWARYYKIRAERRKLVGRLDYKEAFKAGKEWPEESEYREYELSNKLREASRNWNNRVPKLHDRLPSSAPKVEKKPEAEGEKEE